MARWLVLSGYMGAGKTSVGRRVATRLGCAFIDLDRAIEERAGMPIPEIFSRRGELWFRRTEETVIRELVAGEPGVLALGGRVARERPHPEPADARGRRGLAAHERRGRLVARQGLGPPAGDRPGPLRAPGARRARPAYREAADLEVDADGPVDEVAARVAAWAQRERPRAGA